MHTDETPQERKVPFTALHPPVPPNSAVKENDWVVCSDLPGVWQVQGFYGDFARLVRPHQIQARRRGRLRRVDKPPEGAENA